MHHHIKRCALMAIFALAARVEAQPTFSIDSVGPFDAYTLVTTITPHTLFHLEHPMSGYMDTQQVDDVRGRWRNLIDQSLLDELADVEGNDTSGSSNLAFLGFFATNGKNVSTFNQTTDRLDTLSVSSSTRSSMMGAFDEVVAQGNQVNAKCDVDNTGSNQPLTGKVILFRISGRVRTEDNNERPFRALSRLGVIASGVGALPKAQAICRYESTGLGPIIPSEPTQTTQTTSTETTTEATEPPQTTTEATEPPQTTTEPPQTTTEATEPPQTTTEATEPPQTTTEATEPPQTTTEATEPPETTTEATEPPETTSEVTEPVQTDPVQTSSEVTEPVQTEPVSTDPVSTSVTDVVSTSATDPAEPTDPVVTRPPVDTTSPTEQPSSTDSGSEPGSTNGTNGTDATSPGGTSATGQPLIDGTGDPSGSVRHGASSYVTVFAAFTSLVFAAWSAEYR